MKTMRGIVKWTIRREGRIGCVWRRHRTGSAEKGRTSAVVLCDSNRRMPHGSESDWCEEENTRNQTQERRGGS